MIHNLFIFGTRPEAIKLAPLILKMKADSAFKVTVCVTGQHRVMLNQVLEFFNIVPDIDLNIMKPNQSLFDITADGLRAIETILSKQSYDLITVQGDTTSAFIGALSAYYKKIPVAHIEAGLRSYEKHTPFPEEINRTLVSSLADFHFSPIKDDANNLGKMNINEHVYIVGNTVIDALTLTLDKIKPFETDIKEKLEALTVDFNKKILLATLHRRESFGKPIQACCDALTSLAKQYPDTQIVIPVHFNPVVKEPLTKALHNIENIILIDPLPYPEFVYLMKMSTLIMSDSGGIQEEAPSLGKPVVVMRDVTERQAGIKAGVCDLSGTAPEKIITSVKSLLDNPSKIETISKIPNPFGDGKASDKILDVLKTHG